MLYGVREICDVVLRAKKYMTIGDYVFEKDMPVFYFDSLKTSSLEGQATTVYAQGGKGNARLVAWEGERTVTFTMEDALISPITFSMLTGAGVANVQGGKIGENISYVHCTATSELFKDTSANANTDYPYFVKLPQQIAQANEGDSIYTYIMRLDDNGDIASMPKRVAPVSETNNAENGTTYNDTDEARYRLNLSEKSVKAISENSDAEKSVGQPILIDYYTVVSQGLTQITIDAEHFAGNYYLEASTLFRDKSGTDHAAEFIVPNCKIQSNFTFSMAATGDPSTFTFTMDAFPDYLKFDKSKKVIAALQVIEGSSTADSSFTNGEQAVPDYSTGKSNIVFYDNTDDSTDDSTGDSTGDTTP